MKQPMPTFMRIGLLLFCSLGIAAGLLLLLGNGVFLNFCGKSCGVTQGMMAIFGKDVARILIATIWLSVAGAIGWVAIRKK